MSQALTLRQPFTLITLTWSLPSADLDVGCSTEDVVAPILAVGLVDRLRDGRQFEENLNRSLKSTSDEICSTWTHREGSMGE